MSDTVSGSGSLPLTQEHYQMLKGVQEIAYHALPIMQKCKDCGLPVDAEIDAMNRRAEFAAAVLRNFFPDQP